MNGGRQIYQDTGVGTTTTGNKTAFQRMRIEISTTTNGSGSAIFMINGRVTNVITQTTRSLPVVPLSAGIWIQAGTANRGTGGVTGHTGGINNLDVSYIKTWIDDPPGGVVDSGTEVVETMFTPTTADPSPPLGDPVTGASLSYHYLGNDPSTFPEGTIVSMDRANRLSVASSSIPYDKNLMGVVALQSHSFGDDDAGGQSIRVGMSGRVGVNVSLVNGPIVKGDRVTSSYISGVGMRATRPGFIVGVALEDFDPSHGLGVCDGMDVNTSSTTAASTDINVLSECRTQILVNATPNFDMSSSLLVQDDAGRFGIGTSSPEYALHVIGDIAAESFVNISTATAKTDIAYLDDEDKGSILESIRGTKIAEYRYRDESINNPLRIGLIAEEAPVEVLSVSGKGVDIYKLSTFILAGLQEEDRRITDLEARVAALEAIAENGGFSMPDGGASTGVLAYLSSLGTKIASGVAEFASVITSNFTVGSSSKPAGITLYDSETGAPYCVKIVGGEATTTAGACPMIVTENADTEVTDDVVATSTPAAAVSAPVISINGANPAEIFVGSSYADLGAAITAPQSALNLGLKALVNGVDVGDVSNVVLDTASTSVHTIEYYAVDENGNRGSAVRMVNVVSLVPQPSVVEEVVEDSVPESVSEELQASSTPETSI